MQRYQREFVDFMVEADVLTFGDFVTKSGRPTPYFINAGRYRTGAQIGRLGRFYAQAIVDAFGDVDVLFGPAYKGIPLVVTTSMALAGEHGRDTAFCFNRKEAKDHGEGGVLVGHPLQDGDRVVIVEDVTTAGTSIRETVPILRAAADIELVGLVVSVDRQERGSGGVVSALREVGDEFGMATTAIVTIDEIVAHLRDREVGGRRVLGDDDLERIATYRAEYGA
ncbi:MAG: orotate phosphoribosyltransferase [Actinobacteria bacterium]|nr:orotate phosphoribosyltransferase [Actinomycetota bacterium]